MIQLGPGRAARGRWRALVCVLAIATTLAACDRARLDENLCPIGETTDRRTILLLDTSDPLTPSHQAEFKRLITEMQSPAGPEEFRVTPGEKLIVYELPLDAAGLKPEPDLQVCNPGDRPDDWTWKEELTQGKMIALRRWQHFRESVEPLFEVGEVTPRNRSPIIETLGVIVPRHAPSVRMNMACDGGRTHLIVFSDLLQHSDQLSHYGAYPAGDVVRKTHRALHTDLRCIDVSLYRLERSRDARFQSTDHYFWWTKLIQSFGGTVVYQDSV